MLLLLEKKCQNKFLFIFILSISTFISYGQEYSTGLIFANAEELEGIPLASTPFSGDELPHKVDLSSKFPLPGFQGKQNSCAAWAVAYALKSYQEALEEKQNTFTEANTFSPAFVYNQINNGRDGGALLKDALNVLSSQGSVALAQMPYNDKDFLTQPNMTVKSSAKKYRIDFYRKVNVQDIKEVKAQLNAGYPVVIGAIIDKNFQSLRNGQIWDRPSERVGGHAMLVVGYDDTKSAFKLLNSWGRTWAEGGYGWISYNLFSQVVREAYVAKDATNGTTNPTITPVPTNTINPYDLITFKIDNIQHNVNYPVFGSCMKLRCFSSVPPGINGTIQVVVYFYYNNGGLKGNPAPSYNINFRAINGQLACATIKQFILISPTGSTGTWDVFLPYSAFGVPVGNSYNFIAEPTLYINDFGIRSGGLVPVTVNNGTSLGSAYLGIQFVNILPNYKLALNIHGGVVITSVVHGSPASIAGLQINDIIIMFDNKIILDQSNFTSVVQPYKPFTPVSIQIIRIVNGVPYRYQAQVILGKK